MSKETFILRTEWWDAISDFSDQEKANILNNLFHFHRNQHDLIDFTTPVARIAWKLIEPNLIRNIAGYDKRRETSALNGSKGGRPTEKNNLNKPISKPKITKEPIETLSVSVSVSDSVLLKEGKVEKSESELAFERFQTWLKKDATNVSKMSSPITPEQYEALTKDFSKEFIMQLFLDMHNTKDLVKKYTSANLTFRNWAKRRTDNPLPVTTAKTVTTTASDINAKREADRLTYLASKNSSNVHTQH